MNIAKAYTGGFLKAVKLPRMLFILYIANLFTALLLALPFKGVLQKSFAQSGIVSNLVDGFNYTAIAQLFFENGDAILSIIGGIKWLILAYFLLSVFLTGGIIGTYNKEKFTTSHFFGSAAYNFFRFLGLSALVLVVQIIFILLIYIPLGIILQSVSETAQSEVTLYNIAIGGFVFHLLIFLLISMIGDYAKFYLVLNNSFNIFKGFGKGVQYVFKHFFKTYLLYLFLLFLPAVIMYVYLYLENDIKMATGIGILIVFLMQQAFMFLRSFLRAWVLGSQYQMYAYDFAMMDPVQSVILKVFNQKNEKTEKKQLKEKPKGEEKPVDQQKAYAIDFNSTFSAQNEHETDDSIVTEEELLKKMNEEPKTEPVLSNSKNMEFLETSSSSIDNEAIIDEPEDLDGEAVLDNDETLEEIAENEPEEQLYREQLIEAITVENSVKNAEDELVNENNPIIENKTYSSGETVEFDEEVSLEEKMAENYSDEEIPDAEKALTNEEQLSDSELEEKLAANLLTEENPVAEIQEPVLVETVEDLNGEAEISDENIDNEAVLSDGLTENEAELESENLDEDNEHRYETVDRNVLEENESEDSRELNKKGEKKKEDDNFEFEL